MPKLLLQPWWTSPDSNVEVYQGDALEVLRQLPAKSVQCCVTSPPYWGLRDYKVAGQLGHEESPDCLVGRGINCAEMDWENGCYVCRMVLVFREVRRVLRDDGVLWLNLGDSYADGNLTGVPWRVALALQYDGWDLRQDVIWNKPNAMPESVQNRCSKAHEYVFLLAKQPRYFYDAEAIKERSVSNGVGSRKYNTPKKKGRLINGGEGSGNEKPEAPPVPNPVMANKRSVWTINTQAFPGKHYAVFPEELAKTCMLAGTSEKGCCSVCGAPWQRVVERTTSIPKSRVGYTMECGSRNDGDRPGSYQDGSVVTKGWQPSCKCVPPWEEPIPAPCVVLDPFLGSGTTAVVCGHLGLRCIGIELSKDYLRDVTIPRIERPYVISAGLLANGKRAADALNNGG